MSPLSDSSVICAYIDEAYPGPDLLPAGPKDRARARWLEEYADTRLGDLFIWGLFYQKIVHQLVWGEPGDQERDRKDARRGPSGSAGLPRTRAPGRRLPVRRRSGSPTSRSRPSSATAPMPGSRSIPERWPRTAAFVERTLDHRPSPRYCRSRMSSAARKSAAAARHCSMPARRSPPRPTARASRGAA